MLDLLESTILYCGLFLLFLWRLLVPWPRGKSWVNSVNYVTALYALCLLVFIFEFVNLVAFLVQDGGKLAKWQAVGAALTPVVVLATIGLCWMNCRAHLREIQESGSLAVLQHDRVMNIGALPAVYSVVVMGALAAMLPDMIRQGQGKLSDTDRELSFAISSTFEYVGKVYEAWALLQFGTLVSELLDEAFSSSEVVLSPKRSQRGGPSVVVSISAFASVMWVGLTLFGVVCFAQAGWSLYVWYSDILRNPDTSDFEESLQQFHLAGLIASAAAIYNVWKFEDTFGECIEGFAPFLKFFSIKIIVFFAFWQETVIKLLSWLRILSLTGLQIKCLSQCLMCFECLLCAVVALHAWRAEEVWYTSTQKDKAIDERAPLMPGGAAGNILTA